LEQNNKQSIGNYRESEDNVIRFPEIEGLILEKVIQYLHYKKHHMKSTGKIPEFKIEPEIALELLMASNYLQC
jgi:transcription elongation factor B subunit 1